MQVNLKPYRRWIGGLLLAVMQTAFGSGDVTECETKVVITMPADGDSFCPGKEITLKAEERCDTDECILGPDDGVPQSDDEDYSWTDDAGGAFKDGDNVGASVVYIAPATAGTVTLTVTVDRDAPDADLTDSIEIEIIKLDLDVDSDYDGDIDNDDDAKEESHGAIVVRNSDGVYSDADQPARAFHV